MKTFFTICLLFSLMTTIYSAPVTPRPGKAEMSAEDKAEMSAEDKAFVRTYEEKYHSWPPSRIQSSNNMREKIAKIQEHLDLPVTGKLDNETKMVMLQARCGNPDVDMFSIYDKNVKWNKNYLTYRIVNYTNDMYKNDVDHVIRKASQVWAHVTPLKFTQITSGNPDIMISFGKKSHGDFFPFDGPNGTLAHAFPPFEHAGDLAGDIHFDDDELFSLDSNTGFILFVVAVHEFGHSLGLYHSSDRNSIMFPIYRYWDPDYFTLPADDIQGIQTLYGPNYNVHPNLPDPDEEDPYTNEIEPTHRPHPGEEEPTHRPRPGEEEPTHQPRPGEEEPTHQPRPGEEEPTHRPRTNEVEHRPPDICDKLILDAVTTLRGEMLFFKGRFLWRIHTDLSGVWPYHIKSFWPDIPRHIDAAYENLEQDKVIFFKDDLVWEISHDRTHRSFKTLSSFGLPSSVVKVNAALYDETTGKTLFFVGESFYSYDEKRKELDSNHPREVREIFGIEGEVNAAFQLRGVTYLFSGPYVYKFSAEKKLTSFLKNSQFFHCK